MSMDRRNFLKLGAAAAAGAATVGTSDKAKAQPVTAEQAKKHAACLVDTTLCVGCRKCEQACNQSNKLPRPDRPFTDKTVFRDFRLMTAEAFTVVNEFPGQPSPDQNSRTVTYAKRQCMHCLDPSCVSACIVGAITKAKDGPVVYEPGRCLGCRYCMTACPFGVPAYEYNDPITPRVRKCEYCTDPENYAGAKPACAAACPMEAIVFGERGQLLEMAHERIKAQPDRYVAHVYGEKEVGGTSWLYLTGREPSQLNLLDLPESAPPRVTEAIQHGIFKWAAIPTAVYASLGGIMWWTTRNNKTGESKEEGGEK